MIGKRFIDKALQPIIDRQLKQFAQKEVKKQPKLTEQSFSKMANEFERDFHGYINNPDPILAKKNWDFYKEVARDNQVHTCESVKKIAVLSSPWHIEPASDDEEDIKIAEFTEWGLRNIKGTFRKKLKSMLSAFEYGFSITEKTYGYIDTGEWKGKVSLKYLKTRDPEYLHFNLDDFGNIKEIKQEIGFKIKKLKEDDMVVYSHDSEFENPYGRADVQFVYKPYIMKKWVMRFWSIALERFGMGIMVATYERGNKDQIKYLEDIFENLQARMGIMIPEGIKIEIKQAVGSGKMAYESALDRYDKAIARGILIPDLLGFSEFIKGSYALGEKHFDIFTWVVEEIRGEIQETLVDEQIIKPWLNLNYANLTEYPKYKFNPLTEDKKNNIIKLWGELVKLGAVTPIPEDDVHIRKWLEFPEREVKEEEEEEPETKPIEIPEKEEPKEEEKIIPIGSEKLSNFSKRMKIKHNPTRCQKVIDFAQYNKDWNTIENKTIENMKNVMERTRDDFLKMIDKKSLLAVDEPASETAIEKIQLKHIGDFKRALENGLVNGYLNSKYKALTELQKIEAPLRKKFAFDDADMIPEEALAFFKGKIPIKKKELLFYIRKAFTISGIERERILGEAKIILYNHMRHGDVRKTKKLLRTLFDKYLETGEIKDGKLLAPYRIETIVRTNIAEAMNAGRMTMYDDPDVQDFIVAYTLSIVDDDMTSDECRDRIGEVYDKDEFMPPPYHYNCYDKQTEILTQEEGFKQLSEIKGNEKVMTVNLDGLIPEYQSIKNIIAYSYKGKMIGLKAYNFDLLVKPDHNMVFAKRWNYRVNGEKQYELIKTTELPSEGFIPRRFNYDNKSLTYLTFEDFKIDGDTFASLMGWYLSEGSIDIKSSSISARIKISQENELGKKQILEDLKELELNDWKGGIYIKVSNEFGDYLKALGHSANKYIPKEIMNASRHQIELFLEAFCNGDGSHKKGKENWNGGNFRNYRMFFTSSNIMASQIGELIMKIGKTPSYSFENNKGKKVKFRNGTYEIKTNMWRIYEGSGKDFGGGTSIKDYMFEADYDDMVYSVEVEKYNTLVVRRNGKVCISGNCRSIPVPITKGETFEKTKWHAPTAVGF